MLFMAGLFKGAAANGGGKPLPGKPELLPKLQCRRNVIILQGDKK